MSKVILAISRTSLRIFEARSSFLGEAMGAFCMPEALAVGTASGVPRVGRVGKWIRKLSLACVIIGTPGDGESTKPLSHATKTSLYQQFSERRPEFASRVWAHYTSLEFLSSGAFDGFTKNVYGIMWQSDNDGMTNLSYASVPTSLQRIGARYPMPFKRAA